MARKKIRIRRPRSIEELHRDPQFIFHVGRLMGTAETASHLLTQEGAGWMQQDTVAIGRSLARAVAWFYETDEVEEPPTVVTPPPPVKA